MSDEAEKEELPEIDESVVDEAGDPEEPAGSEGEIGRASDLGLIMEVPLRLSVEIGSARMPVRDVLALAKGSIVELDRMNGDPADVYVNDRLIARGEVTVQDERVAVRVTELVTASYPAPTD
ncbi:MAG TPA: flagellar motor switch protein FliN [Deltaproteobacteria bacterium]|nr:flagellar motor switch protein FliN [Deltaproteobacteria bacterium]